MVGAGDLFRVRRGIAGRTWGSLVASHADDGLHLAAQSSGTPCELHLP